MKRLENNLKDYRSLTKKTQMDLYLETEISHTKISWIERGYVMATPSEKEKIANALGVPVERVFPNG